MSKIFSRDIRSTVEWSIVLCSIRGISREIQFSLSGASRIRQWNSKGKRDFESLPKGEKFFALPFLLPFFFFLSLVFSRSLSLFYGQRKIHFRKRLPPGYPGYFSLGGNWIFVVFLRPWIFFFFFRRITIRIIGRIIRVAVRAMEPCEQRTPLLLPSPRQWRRPGTN